MSEENPDFGTVRRRPRGDYQHTEAEFEPNGQEHAEGARKRNGENGRAHADFGQERSRRRAAEHDRSSTRDRRRNREENSRERREAREGRRDNLPWREIAAEAPLFRCPFDPWRLFGAVKRRSVSIALVATALTIGGFFLGMWLVPYKMSLPLIRKTSNAVRSDSALPGQFTPREYSDGTLYAFMKNREVIGNVIEKAQTNALLAPLHLSMPELAGAISVVPLPNPDFVILKLKTFGNLDAMAELLNLYAQEAVDYLRKVQRSESATINEYLQTQLAVADKRIQELKVEIRKLSDSGIVSYDVESKDALSELRKTTEALAEKKIEFESIDAQLTGLDAAVPNARLLAAEQELQELLINRTPQHPDVIAKQREIEVIKKQQAAGTFVAGAPATGNDPMALRRVELITSKPKLQKEIQELTLRLSNLTNSLAQRTGRDMSYAVKEAELESSRKAYDELLKSAREAQLYAEASLGYFGIREPATPKSIDTRNRWLKVSAVALLFGMLGAFFTMGIALISEALDTTLKTPEDIMRVCKLPVLASLGDLHKMSAKQQADWAFRTLTLLKGKLGRNSDEALVCGIISANHGEGRSTWVNLLVNAASQRGLRVLTVDTRPGAAKSESAPPPPDPEPEPAMAAAAAGGPGGVEKETNRSINLPDQPSMPIVKDPLSTPEKVAEQLEGASPLPLVHIPLPGWVWSLERRKKWQNALESWKHVDNLIIFVELPPACESESVLLAENMPQVIWLVASGMADAAETAAHLETLRHAHCNLVGAVLNHAPPPYLSSKIGRWLNPVAGIALLASTLCLGTVAAEPETHGELQVATAKPEEGNMGLSANSRRQRARWQEHLTFGPGDTIDIHFYGNDALTRTNVLIGPDGKINYLQATSVPAAGLTVEELRDELDKELVNFYPNVRTIVLPVNYASKKYYILGKVNAKGAYVLNRPLTLVEAVARAKGLETGLYQRTTVELADLEHSFIVRNGQKLPVDFQKLFLEGDLRQNVALEPNDYIYFASTSARDIYVLGEVMNPGPLGFVEAATVLTSIADRGGFSEKAFKRRVLVVRGSLEQPETFVINTDATLDAMRQDFRLQPRDIVYVSRRPWVKAEELLDEAAASFIQGAVTTWAGVNAGPFITGRIIPRVNK